jgi:hypothetical protein
VRVPLASIHITGKPCRVARICNWTIHRKIATTFPSLQYWLSMLPFGTMLRQMLDTVCCFNFGAILNQGDYKYAAAAGVAENNGADVKNYEAGAAWQHANAMLNPTIERPQPVAGAFGMLSAALGRSGQQLEFSTLVESFMLRADKRDPEIDYLSAVETANLPQFLAANEFMRPAVTEALGPALSLLTRLPKMMAGAAPADNAAPDALASMKTQLAALQKSVQAQAEEIARIKEGRPQQAPRGKRKPPG